LGEAGLADAGLWLALVLGATIASWLLHGPGRVLERNVSLAVRGRIATSLTERLLALPLSWHEASHSGATAHRVQQSSSAISGFAQSQFIRQRLGKEHALTRDRGVVRARAHHRRSVRRPGNPVVTRRGAIPACIDDADPA